MKKLLLISVLVQCASFLHAQKYYVVKVTDSKKEDPIVNASVKIKSTDKIFLTDTLGIVLIQVSPEDTLLVHYKGYTDREIILVKQAAAISVIMDRKPVKNDAAKKPQKDK